MYKRIRLQLDDAAVADVIADSADDGDWDEADDSWQEVGHADSAVDDGDVDDADSAAAAAGELLAAAVDPLYHMSSKRCAAAARAALRVYLQVGHVMILLFLPTQASLY